MDLPEVQQGSHAATKKESQRKRTMKFRVLGSATSMGVPVISCKCPVCTSQDSRNFRTRTSAVFQKKSGETLLVDTSPDLRSQLLQNNLQRIDAVLFTHAHADHIAGLDDLRVFNFIQRQIIPVHAHRGTIQEIRKRFSYIFQNTQRGGGKPLIKLKTIRGPFSTAGFDVTPVPLWHGRLRVLGFRIGDLAYCTDVSRIPNDSYKLLKGLKVLVIDALRRNRHPTHFSLDQALDEIKKIKPKRAILTHLTHQFDHRKLKKELPDNVEPAFDGMVVRL